MIETQRIVIIAGISGAGCSTALKAFEDFNFTTVSRLPVSLLAKYVQEKHSHRSEKIAILPEIKSKESLNDLMAQITKESRDLFQIIFLDALDDTIVKRYSETRRPHPDFAKPEDKTLIDAIHRERRSLIALKEIANLVIDTSALTVHDLKREISKYIESEFHEHPRLTVNLVSFGYKNGIPTDCDLLVDVRFLPNPYFIEELRDKTGLDNAVSQWVMKHEDADNFLKQYAHLLNFLIPKYAQEGKAYLRIGVGCTGGQHRSVTLVESLSSLIKFEHAKITKYHRDIRN
jgi:UPF0042 nucleotide-binding protein